MSDRDKLGQKLYSACYNGDTAEVKRLIAKGAPVDWQDGRYGYTPLILAARYTNMTIARELAWSLCDLKIRNKKGKTAADVAKEKGNDALAEYLANQAPREQAEIRADPSRKEALRKRYQPQAEQERLGQKLLKACKNGWTAEAKGLIAKGAPVDWQDEHGWAPLHMASMFGYTEIVMLLHENKCDVNVTDIDGNTPLILAAYSNKMDTVRALVEAGCDITIRGDKNKTAAERAKQEGYHAIAEYLTNEAPRVRFHSSARNESGQLHRVKGRCKRALGRDLKEIAGFDDHMLHKLAQFCTGRR